MKLAGAEVNEVLWVIGKNPSFTNLYLQVYHLLSKLFLDLNLQNPTQLLHSIV